MENTLAKKVEIIFSTHPEKEIVYTTSDERAWWDENDARNHANSLTDRTVTIHENTDSAIDELEKDEVTTEPRGNDVETSATQEQEESTEEISESKEQEAVIEVNSEAVVEVQAETDFAINEKTTIEEIKAYLDANGVAYKVNSKKSELVELVENLNVSKNE